MMRRLSTLLFAAVAVALFSGCAFGPMGYGPGGTMPAFVYTGGQVYPAENTSTTQYTLTTDDFEIRGTVVAEGEAVNILGIISHGNNGYEALMSEARLLGADDVMNVRVDVSYTNFLFFYSKVNTRLSGQGVRWKR